MSEQRPIVARVQSQEQKWAGAGWYHALTLAERKALGKGGDPCHSTRAERRVQEWKALFKRDDVFMKRLAQDDLAEEELLQLLAEPVATLQERYERAHGVPEWLRTLQRAFHNTQAQERDGAWLWQAGRSTRSLERYLQPLQPLFMESFERLARGIEELRERYGTLPFEAQEIVQMFSTPLAEQVLARWGKVFVLEMHVARLQGELRGETPEERFEHFIERLAEEDTLVQLLEEYPVLARQLVQTLDHWVAYTREFLTHLCCDWPEICRLFSPGQDPGRLVGIQSGVGDAHRQGRSVHILTFESGLRLLYKPRSLAVDSHFQEVLLWLNEQGAQPAFRTITLLDRGTYGWAEWVREQSCTTEDEVTRFFERQGSYLALLYSLNAIDIHVENLIAAGEHPILVDLEALFHPHIEEGHAAQPFQMGLRSMEQSVFRIGLLPCRLWSTREEPGVDLSGLGGQAGQMTPFRVPQWEAGGTDQMHLVRKSIEAPAGQNRPRLKGEDVEVLNYRAQILQGFTRTYRLLQEQREEVINEILPRFAQDEVRLLFRPTQRYARLLRESFHPDLLRDSFERECFFDQLWREVEKRPSLERVFAAEKRDLQRGDIPFFRNSPQSRNILTSDGEIMEDFFETSSLDLVRQRLCNLDEQDLARQQWIIEAALATLRVGPERVTGKVLEIAQAGEPVQNAELLAAACAVGDHLETLALRNDNGVCWLGVSAVGDATWSLLPTDNDLYNGTGGIALFLAYLGAITGVARYTDLARSAVTAVREQALQQSQVASLGTFDGLGSVIYLLMHMSVLWHEPDLLQEAETLAALLPASIEVDERLDVVSGVAGCALTMLRLHALHPTAQTLKIAQQCGDRLIATAQSMPQGKAWITIKGEQPLGGFAHGAAGIALSLLMLEQASGEARYRQAALDALTYERSLYVPAEHNWLDLRTNVRGLTRRARLQQTGQEEGAQAQTAMAAWCHGAVGIGLGRVGGLPYLDDASVREEIEAAIQTGRARGLQDNHSLCHGALGTLDLLLTATQALEDTRYRQLLTETTAMVLHSITACGWVAGVPLGVETPGLMTGLAGIGYELLRLAEPKRVPSVLLVEGPRVLKNG